MSHPTVKPLISTPAGAARSLAAALEHEPTRPPAFRLYRGPDMDWDAPAKRDAQRMEHLAARREEA